MATCVRLLFAANIFFSSFSLLRLFFSSFCAFSRRPTAKCSIVWWHSTIRNARGADGGGERDTEIKSTMPFELKSLIRSFLAQMLIHSFTAVWCLVWLLMQSKNPIRHHRRDSTIVLFFYCFFRFNQCAPRCTGSAHAHTYTSHSIYYLKILHSNCYLLDLIENVNRNQFAIQFVRSTKMKANAKIKIRQTTAKYKKKTTEKTTTTNIVKKTC